MKAAPSSRIFGFQLLHLTTPTSKKRRRHARTAVESVHARTTMLSAGCASVRSSRVQSAVRCRMTRSLDYVPGQFGDFYIAKRRNDNDKRGGKTEEIILISFMKKRQNGFHLDENGEGIGDRGRLFWFILIGWGTVLVLFCRWMGLFVGFIASVLCSVLLVCCCCCCCAVVAFAVALLL